MHTRLSSKKKLSIYAETFSYSNILWLWSPMCGDQWEAAISAFNGAAELNEIQWCPLNGEHIKEPIEPTG